MIDLAALSTGGFIYVVALNQVAAIFAEKAKIVRGRSPFGVAFALLTQPTIELDILREVKSFIQSVVDWG